ncbi:hypothetical protein B0H10DRAFT_2101872 [Mycena sp. CBHHK59/15]|nr:hypothetical protein B0H10DRAFT_2101872 [Mycena sp. CBHHK59/15]
MRLNEISVDVLLYILTLVPLEDAISLILVSREFQSLSRERSFWIYLLDTARKSRPLPCPDDEDISTYDLPDLKRLVFHTIRRDRNWSRPVPDIRGPIDTLALGPGHSLILSISGTSLLLIHSQQDGVVTCWNVNSGLALDSVYIGRSVFHTSLSCGQKKSRSIALLVAEELTADYASGTPLLVVLTIQHTASVEAVIAVSFRRSLGTGLTFGQLFINAHLVGLLRVFDMEPLDIVAFNRESGACRVIHTDTLYDSQMGAFLDHALYIVKDRSEMSSNVHMCPENLLPYSDTHDGDIHMADTLHWADHGARFWDGVDATFTGFETWFEALGAVTARPVRGVALATLHHINVNEELSPRAINIRFWSFTEGTDGDVTPSRRLAPAHTLNIRGELATSVSLQRYLIAYSGVNVLLVVNYRGKRSLRLVQYGPSSSSSTIHLLEMPSSIDLTAVTGIALDDHRGSVVLIAQDGALYSVAYA